MEDTREAPTAPAVRDISFHSAVRGYDRHDVDRYVQRMNRLITELEMTRSPESAVRHALDKVGEQTSGILQRARETADEIIGTAKLEAEEAVARADAQIVESRARDQQEMEERRARARAEMEALRADMDELAQERERMLDEIRELAQHLEQLAGPGAVEEIAQPELEPAP